MRFYRDAGAVTDPDDIDDDGDGFTENRGDCNDQDATIYPGAPEICGDGIDQNCDGRDSDCNSGDDPNDVDNDGDGFTENQGDCNDYNATIYPGASEIGGDRIDQNCDGRDEECSVVDPPDVEPLLPTLYFPLFYDDFNGQTYIGLLNNSGTETLEGELIAFNRRGYSLNELNGTQPYEVVLEPLGRLEVSLSEILADADVEVAYVKFVGTINSGLGYCRFAVEETGQAAAYPALYEPEGVKELQLPWLTFAEGWNTRVGFINISALWMKYEIEFNNGAVLEGRTLSSTGDRFWHEYLDISGDLKVKLKSGVEVLLKDTSPLPTAATIRFYNALSDEDVGAGIVGAVLYSGPSAMGAVALKPAQTSPITYPYIVHNSFWWTALVAYNAGEEECSLKLKPFNGNGTLYSDPDLHFTDRQSIFTAVDLYTESPLFYSSGWLEADNSCSMMGLEIVGSADLQQLGFLSAFTRGSKSGVFPRLGDGWVGMSLLNPGSEPVNVTLRAYSDRGDYVAEKRSILEPYSQALLSHYDIAGDNPQATSIRFTANHPVMGLLFNGKDYEIDGETLKQLDILPALMVETTGSEY